MRQRIPLIRLARADDARVIGELARRVVRRWILPDQPSNAGKALLARLSARVIRDHLRQGQRFYVAHIGHVLVGVCGMRDDCHLVQFFVSTRYQGQGIARKLWRRTMQDALRRAGTSRFSLNATRCAVPIYQRLGFARVGRERLSPNGVLTTPMVLDLKKTARAARKRA